MIPEIFHTVREAHQGVVPYRMLLQQILLAQGLLHQIQKSGSRVEQFQLKLPQMDELAETTPNLKMSIIAQAEEVVLLNEYLPALQLEMPILVLPRQTLHIVIVDRVE